MLRRPHRRQSNRTSTAMEQPPVLNVIWSLWVKISKVRRLAWREIARESVLLVCEHCFCAFDQSTKPAKRLKVSQDEYDDDGDDDDNGEEDEEEEQENDDAPEDQPSPKTNSDQPKAVAAVEQAMTDEELQCFHQYYISILQQHRQAAQPWPEKKLHQMIVHLFQSLQYRHDKPDGLYSLQWNPLNSFRFS